MNILFFEHLNIFNAINLFFFRRNNTKIYYFNISKPAHSLLCLLKLNNSVIAFDFDFWEMRDDSGGTYLSKIFGSDILEAVEEIKNKALSQDALINEFKKMFDPQKVDLYFSRVVYKEISDVIVYLNVISFKYRKQPPITIEFCVEPDPRIGALREFALKKYQVKLKSNWSFKRMNKFFYLLLRNLYLDLEVFFKAALNLLRLSKGFSTSPKGPALLSVLYALKGFTFDRDRRCDFPWLLDSTIPGERVLMYFDRKDAPVTSKMASSLQQRKIKHMALQPGAAVSGSGIPVYSPTLMALKVLMNLTIRVLFLAGKELLRFRRFSITYLNEMLAFVREYAKAVDFFSTNNIKVNIDPVDHDYCRIPRHLGLEAVGGVSVSYQISNWPVPNIVLASSADIMIMFGPHYYSIFSKSGSCGKQVIFSGFLTDYAFAAVQDRSKILRQKITAAGAKFIVCYFDENSSNDRMGALPNKRSRYIYEQFLNWVIKDKTMGLIVSPKRPKTLLHRLPEIALLLGQAKNTGRCIFMDGEYTADNFPSEPAQAADLVVSLLSGGTTSLESFLSGKRVVYLDLEKFYSYPEYRNGRGSIVFDDFDSFKNAVDRYRLDKESFDQFGNINLAPNIKDKDPFQDGKAAQRMNQYLQWLLDGFDSQLSRSDVIKQANEKYRAAWGADKVVECH